MLGGAIWGVDRWQAERRAAAAEAIRQVGGRFVPKTENRGARVYFAGPKVTDDALAELQAALDLLQPRQIDFDQCPITDSGLKHLAPFVETKVIHIHATNATEAGIEQLRQSLPNADIRTTKPDPVASSLVAHTIYPHALNRVAYAPDGGTIVAGDGNGMLFVIDRGTAAMKYRIQAHESWLFTVAFSPQGDLLATGGGDGWIRLWNTDTWKLHREFQDQADDVHGIAFSPDGKHLVSGGDDHAVRLWNLQTGKLERTIEGHEDSVTTVAFSPDGKSFASGSRDNTIHIHSVVGPLPPKVLRSHDDDVMTIAYHPRDSRLASVGYDGKLILWDLEQQRPAWSFKAHSERAYSVAFQPAGNQLATSAGDGAIQTWDYATGKRLRTIVGPRDVSCVSWHPKQQEFAASSAEGNIQFCDANSAIRMFTFWTRDPYPPEQSFADVPLP